MSETKNIYKAIIKFQGEVGTVMYDAKNPFFKSDYATLAQIMETIREPMKDNGLAVFTKLGKIDGEIMTMETFVVHESGESIQSEFDFPLPLQQMKDENRKPVGEKVTPQSTGSAITYARRYSIAAILGIVTDKDDDGNAAQEAMQQSQAPQKKKKAEPKTDPAIEAAQKMSGTVKSLMRYIGIAKMDDAVAFIAGRDEEAVKINAAELASVSIKKQFSKQLCGWFVDAFGNTPDGIAKAVDLIVAKNSNEDELIAAVTEILENRDRGVEGQV